MKADAEYEQLVQAEDALYPFADLDENTKATTFYTTGTTGHPKGVYFTHRQLVLHTFSVAVLKGSYHTLGRFRSNDVYMPLTPMFHVHAWGFPYVATLLGAKQVYPGPYEPEKLLRLIQREKVTLSHCVPTILQMLLNNPAINEVDLSRWKVLIGGARLPRGLAEAAQERGIEVEAGYGMAAGCTAVTWVLLIRTGICRLPIVSKMSSRPAENGFLPWIWKTCSVGMKPSWNRRPLGFRIPNGVKGL